MFIRKGSRDFDSCVIKMFVTFVGCEDGLNFSYGRYEMKKGASCSKSGIFQLEASLPSPITCWNSVSGQGFLSSLSVFTVLHDLDRKRVM